jgi:hypothetical protein
MLADRLGGLWVLVAIGLGGAAWGLAGGGWASAPHSPATPLAPAGVALTAQAVGVALLYGVWALGRGLIGATLWLLPQQAPGH